MKYIILTLLLSGCTAEQKFYDVKCDKIEEFSVGKPVIKDGIIIINQGTITYLYKMRKRETCEITEVKR